MLGHVMLCYGPISPFKLDIEKLYSIIIKSHETTCKLLKLFLFLS